MTSHSTKTTADQKRERPTKPWPDFPLFAHRNGQWCKKIRGKFHYFGPWGDPDAALQCYKAQADDLHAGRKPRLHAGLTVRNLCNLFLTHKKARVDNGELSPHTFRDYFKVCGHLVDAFGDRLVSDLDVEDFERLRNDLSHGPC